MPEEPISTVIMFTYEADECGCGTAFISDEVNEARMWPSHVGNIPSGNPLLILIDALLHVINYGGESRCRWANEPGEDRWILKREGELLRVTILWFNVIGPGFYGSTLKDELGEPEFSMICNLWKFAAKVRLACSRIIASEASKGVSHWLRDSSEYHGLCAVIDEHKHNQAQ